MIHRFSIAILSAVALCSCVPSQPVSGASSINPGSASARPNKGLFADKHESPTDEKNENLYCRRTVVCARPTKNDVAPDEHGSVDGDCASDSGNSSTRENLVPLRGAWVVRPITALQLASLHNSHYEIYRPYNNQRVSISPALTLEHFDRFTLSYEGDQLFLLHDRGDQYNPAYVSHARLTLRPNSGEQLWAEGYAFTDAGGGDPVGMFRVFLLRDSTPCRHSSTESDRCQSVLVEFYDTNDEFSARNVPVLNQNVVPYDPQLGCSPISPRETGDGEGDEGPNKPR